jgi:two-component system, NarL family, nitrate/nitrite response regulator NarL
MVAGAQVGEDHGGMPMSYSAGDTLPTMGDGPVRVLLADDHPMLREGVARSVRDRPDLTLVGEADTGHRALELIRSERPDVALLDVRMPELDGLGVLRALTADESATRVVFLSAFADGPTVYSALAGGAAGFLTKDTDRQTICDALSAAARGETVLSPGLQTGVADQIRARARADTGMTLTNRELEVLRLAAGGRSGPQIAQILVIAPTTVKSHLQNAYEKLGVSDRVAAVAEAMRRGLLK